MRPRRRRAKSTRSKLPSSAPEDGTITVRQRADRRDPGDLDFAEIALDMVLTGVAHAAMRQHRRLAGAMPGLCGEVFGGISERAGLLAGIVGGGGAQGQQLGRLQLDPALG